jgi:uncharacterized YigZ family protein
MPRYLIPASGHRIEDSIKRSRFITSLAHTETVEQAKTFIAAIQAEFPDATHNCWAFQAGPAGDSAFVGMSDDGEPHGTAGKPMLNVLLHSGIGEIAVVVTRYFGGIKLGTGGLVRAYSGMVSLGLETLPVREKIEPVELEVVIEYGAVTLFKRMLPDHEVEVLAENFGADAVFEVRMPRERREGFERSLMEMTNGSCLVEKL